MPMEKRHFYGPDIDMQALAQSLTEWFARDGYQTQIMPAPNGGLTVQARKEDTLRKIAGMSSALTAMIGLEGEYVSVEMGGAKWADKGVVAGVGAIVFFPALITAGVGAYQQSQLQTKAWRFIEEYVRTNSAFGGSPAGAAPGFSTAPSFGASQAPFQGPQAFGSAQGQPGAPHGPVRPPPPVTMGSPGQAGVAAGPVACVQCGQPLQPGSKFCNACGAAASKRCFTCGHELHADARFCDHCGSPAG
ncbi:MAG: zinc ribbon domain-containing protein [Acidobacteriota bacterium]